MLERLHETIAAVCPIDGLSLSNDGSVGISFRADATDAQRAAASNALAAFDRSPAADAAWQEAKNPERKTLREQAVAVIAANDAFLALAAPTNAQTLAQVKALTRQMTAVIKRVAQL